MPDSDIFLVVADDSQEFPVALRYATKLATAFYGHVAIVRVIETPHFEHWGNVETRMREELRAEAQKLLGSLAQHVAELGGGTPCLLVGDGDPIEAILTIVNEDPHIKMLILAGGTYDTNSGPLVSYFTGRGLGRLRLPVLVVPGHLSPQEVDTLVSKNI